MKPIIKYLKAYIKEDFNPLLYFLVFVFLFILFYSNYALGLNKLVFLKNYGTPQLYLYSFIFYGIAYYLVLFIQSVIKKDFSPFKSKIFIFFSLFGVFILTLDISSYSIFRDLVKESGAPTALHDWLYRVSANFKRIFFLGVVLYIFWKLFDKEQKTFYGFTLKHFDWKPYATMLLIVLPFVVIASTQNSFLIKYPIYKPGIAEGPGGMPYFATIGIFELTYGSRFILVELFFRGFLVIGLGRLIGSRAILPMVVIYAFWHFGKPMPEAVSSIFGGYILAIIAIKSKTVFGGVLIHMGVALSMELFAYLRMYAF